MSASRYLTTPQGRDVWAIEVDPERDRRTDRIVVSVERRRPSGKRVRKQRHFETTEAAEAWVAAALAKLDGRGCVAVAPRDPALDDPVVAGLLGGTDPAQVRQVLGDWLIERDHPHASLIRVGGEQLVERYLGHWRTPLRCAFVGGFLVELDVSGDPTDLRRPATGLAGRLRELLTEVGARLLDSLNVVQSLGESLNDVVATLADTGPHHHLRRLAIRNPSHLQRLDLAPIAGFAPRLRELVVAEESSEPFTLPPGLQSLQLLRGRSLEVWLDALAGCASLEHLGLDVMHDARTTALLGSEACARLRTLSLGGTGRLVDVLPEGARFERTLTELDLRDWRASAPDIEWLVGRFPALRRLRISAQDRALVRRLKDRGVTVDGSGASADLQRLAVHWRIPSIHRDGVLRIGRNLERPPPPPSDEVYESIHE